MIIVTDPAKPFEFTPKGTPRRQISLNAYTKEIDAVYQAVKESSQADTDPPINWSRDNVNQFLHTIINKVLEGPISDNDDLFQFGCDRSVLRRVHTSLGCSFRQRSLQATWIRNTILHAIRESTTVRVHDFPQNFVYTHPSISQLSDFIAGVVARGRVSGRIDPSSKAEEMRQILRKYSTQISSIPLTSNSRISSGQAYLETEVVLLTGCTGRLGSHILHQLLRDPRVVKVYALNRESSGSDAALESRQASSFREWELDEYLLSSDQVVFLACDYAKPMLGLNETRYNEVSSSPDGRYSF